jgi:hypothetical protein
LFYDLAREVPPQLGVNTWLLEHAQLYCFRLSGGQPILDGYGWGATKLSSALHAVRAGVCGKMITEQFTRDTGLRQANEYAKEVRDCVFVNIITRWICWLREQDKTQMNARSIYYDPMGYCSALLPISSSHNNCEESTLFGSEYDETTVAFTDHRNSIVSSVDHTRNDIPKEVFSLGGNILLNEDGAF